MSREMKRVCIVTNYRGTANYGAILQAYALNAYIRSCGLECQTLNYHAPHINKVKYIKDHINHPSIIFSFGRGKVRRWLVKKTYQMRSLVFDQFRDKCIPHTKECNDRTASEIVGDFDILICGSDQIWRPNLQTGVFNDVMWLIPFSNDIPKLSYAASLGITELNEDMVAYVREALRDFRAISVREESAKKLLAQVCGRDVQVVLDPVFLLGRKAWEEFSRDKEGIEKYILVYFIEPKRKLYKQIERFAKESGLEIIFLPYMGYKFNFPDYLLKGKRVIAPTPQEFVGLIRSATYIFTDSFHATAFSLIFHKKLHVFITNHGTRLKNLLKLAGMEDRIVDDPFVVGKEISNERWSSVDRRMNVEKEHSEIFLRQVYF